MARRLEDMQFHRAIISYYVLRRARTRVVKSVVAAAIIVYFCIQFHSSCGVPMRILDHLLELNQMEWLDRCQSRAASANGGDSPPKMPTGERRMARRLRDMQFHRAIISYYVLRRARTQVVKSVVAAAIIVYFCIKFYSSCGVTMRILDHLLEWNQMEWL
ncbi:hypothetical protein CDAR_528711 [Caerostris darwini]|uniref:Uncharacterized protein n=1 Tax=Caerostris darwini TaxID=1538125 RepID=A0AAV4UNZ7_9ARAC|nr:hypothetical protein CDAR_528711 [Caerostris darwini]